MIKKRVSTSPIYTGFHRHSPASPQRQVRIPPTLLLFSFYHDLPPSCFLPFSSVPSITRKLLHCVNASLILCVHSPMSFPVLNSIFTLLMLLIQLFSIWWSVLDSFWPSIQNRSPHYIHLKKKIIAEFSWIIGQMTWLRGKKKKTNNPEVWHKATSTK